jgi:hypothetical protein
MAATLPAFPADRPHAGRWRRAGAVLIAVVLLHAAALHWIGGQLASSGFTEPARPILYTRLITPQPPAPAPAPAAPPAPAPRRAAARPAAAAAEPVVVVASVQMPAPTPMTAPEPAGAASAAAAMGGPAEVRDLSAIAAPAAASAPGTAKDASAVEPPPAADAAGPPPAWPPSTRISYALSGNYRGALHGSATLEWLRDGDGYQLFLRMRSLISQEYRSRGKIAGAWLQPERYEEQGVRGVVAVNFNHESRRLSFSSITDVLDLPEHVQDTASSIMQLSGLLAQQPQQLVAATRLALPVARPRGLDQWEFEVLGSEPVATAQGSLPAWHLRRVPRKPRGDLGVDVWLSPQLQSLPVRIKLTQAEDIFLDLVLEKAEQQP